MLIHEDKEHAAYFTGEIVVTFKTGFTGANLRQFERQFALVQVAAEGSTGTFAMRYPDADFPDLIADIQEYDGVEHAEPVIETPIEPTVRVVPTDFLFPEQWDFEIIEMPEAWFAMGGVGANLQFGSNAIVVAVADPFGPEMGHPDLGGLLNGVPKAFASFDFANNLTPYVLTGTHGTRCASAALAAANRVSAANPNFAEGLTGTAPGCLLVGVQLTFGPTNPNFDEMFRWFSGMTTANPARLARSADIATNSYRMRPPPLALLIRAALEFATDFGRLGRGVPVFYSAANDAGLIFPNQSFAQSNRVMIVTSTTLLATGTRETRTPYSNFGPEAEFCSPSSSRPIGMPVLHDPPNDWGGHAATVTNAVAAAGVPAFADGNLPAPGQTAAVPPATIQSGVNTFTAAGSPTLITNTDATPFIGQSAVMVGAPGTLNAEGLQLTAAVGAPTNRLNLRYQTRPVVIPNTQQDHNGGVAILGGAADYCSDHSGTSYSTPVVAGIGALLMSARPTLSWIEVREILRSTCRKVDVGQTSINGRWRDGAGNTVLDAAMTGLPPKTPPASTTLAADAIAPSNPRTHLNHRQSTLHLANATGFEVGDAIRISGGGNTDFHVIEGKAGNTIAIDSLRRTYLRAVTTVIAGAVRPFRSNFYGFGRVNARRAVQAATAYNHADRDLMIRNHLADTGLADTIAANVPIHSPDIWLRNQADPPLPAPPYDQPGPHQNPVAGNNRFIYARIKNIGQRLANLDAWVHFYVALSDHLPPPVDPVANPAPGIMTPFLFPGDPGNANVAIVARSWCDIPANNITGPAGISSGVRNVYHVRDTTVPLRFNQIIPAGSVAAADPNNVNTGVTVVRVQWNAVDLPPVATGDAIYLLAYVSPVDGVRQGREAGRHNNISYREIAFADFDLFDDTGATPLPASVNVDAFGTPRTTTFQIRARQSIGSYITERLQIEITRTNDNGSTDRAVFRHDGAGWQLLDPGGAAVSWAHLTPPVLAGTATAAAGAQTDVTFAGDFAAALQHRKVTFRAIIHSARGGPLVPIAEESFDIEVIADAPPTPSASASEAVPPQPDSFVFTDFAILRQPQPANKAFGPIDANTFRVTSMFTAATAPKAYAVAAGVVMVQRVDNNRVNLVLRPLRQAGLGMTPVKYYIYRGLRLDHLLDAADNSLVRPQAGAPEFVARLWPIHTAQNPPATPFVSTALGFDPGNQPDTSTIDQFFFASGSGTQFALAKAGEWLGDFFHTGNNEFGLEIVLEEGTAQPTFQNIRQATHIIDVAALPASTDEERFSRRLAQEAILNYMDPAAFYAMHFDGTVRRKPTGTWTDQAVVTNVVDRFATKHKVYIDIRNENGNSYNFYRNYRGPSTDPEGGSNFRFGLTAGSLTETTYGTEGWPLHIVSLSRTTPESKNPLVIELRFDDNRKPVLYVEHGEITSATVNHRFVDETLLMTPPPPAPLNQPYTNPIEFRSPNTGTGSKPTIAWMFKLHYGRQIDPTSVSPPTVVPTDKTLDNLFGPLDLAPLWAGGQAVRWIAAQDKKYVDGQTLGFAQIMERGVAYEGTLAAGRVVFFAALTDQHRNVIAGFTPRRGLTGGTSDTGSFLQTARRFDQYRLDFGSITDGPITITLLNLRPGSSSDPTLTTGILFLGISSVELTQLQGLGGLNTVYPRTFFLEEVTAPAPGVKKFRLGVQGLKADGRFERVMPPSGSDVFVYTVNSLHFASDAFSRDEPLPTTYERNAEEAVGQMSLEFPGAANFTIHSLQQGANGQFNVARDMRQLIAPNGTFQITGNPVNNGTYTVTSVTFNAASGVSTLSVANVPGDSTSGSLQLLPRKIEDHFLDLDPPTVIAGTNPMKQIVESFRTAVAAVINDPGARAILQGHINQFGLQALNRARAAMRDANHANADDRPLYWARLKMQAILKSHEFLVQRVAERTGLVQLLEARTRGLDPAPAFAGAGRRVLLLGFDPFFVRPNVANNNSHFSNPAGVAALCLHGSTAVPGMVIQSVILPVRFADFDAGIVDMLVDNYLQGPNQVNLILSLGQHLDLAYHVTRFATRYRSPSVADNLNVLGQPAVHYELNATQTTLGAMAGDANLPRFLETTLPVSLMVPGSVMAVSPDGTQVAKSVQFDQRFRQLNSAIPEGHESSDPTFSDVVPAPDRDVEEGGAGNYLANELFYRIAWRRTQRNTTLRVGHLQVPKLQSDAAGRSPRFDAHRVQYFVSTIVQILRDALPGI